MTQQFHVEVNVRLSLLIQNSPGERVRKLKAMFARGTMVSMQLSPLVSMKSWRVMAVGSMWCSLNGRIKACRTDQTGCQTGNSTQCKCGKMFTVFITQTNDSILGRNQVMVTFPKMGRSTDPHVSAPQWTSPDAKSAVSIPAAENERVRKVRTTNTARKNWRTLYNFSYQCSTGCTTDVPGENWQEGEWNWRPWERSRGRHLSILDIFCLKGKTPWLNMEHFPDNILSYITSPVLHMNLILHHFI